MENKIWETLLKQSPFLVGFCFFAYTGAKMAFNYHIKLIDQLRTEIKELNLSHIKILERVTEKLSKNNEVLEGITAVLKEVKDNAVKEAIKELNKP